MRIDGGRGNDHLEFRPPGQDLLDESQEEIDVQRTFVGFIDNDGIVGVKETVPLGLGEQNAVGHELDARRPGRSVLEPDLEGHEALAGISHLLRNATGESDRGDAPRLGAADESPDPAPGFETHFRDLSTLPGPRLPRDDHNLVFPNRPDDLLPLFGYGEFFGVREGKGRIGSVPRGAVWFGKIGILEIHRHQSMKICAGS